MPTNSVAKLPRLRKKTRRRKRATKPMRSGSRRPRFVPDLPLASWRKNCRGILPILRRSPTSMMRMSAVAGTTAHLTKISQLQYTRKGGRL